MQEIFLLFKLLQLLFVTNNFTCHIILVFYQMPVSRNSYMVKLQKKLDTNIVVFQFFSPIKLTFSHTQNIKATGVETKGQTCRKSRFHRFFFEYNKIIFLILQLEMGLHQKLFYNVHALFITNILMFSIVFTLVKCSMPMRLMNS